MRHPCSSEKLYMESYKHVIPLTNKLNSDDKLQPMPFDWLLFVYKNQINYKFNEILSTKGRRDIELYGLKDQTNQPSQFVVIQSVCHSLTVVLPIHLTWLPSAAILQTTQYLYNNKSSGSRNEWQLKHKNF